MRTVDVSLQLADLALQQQLQWYIALHVTSMELQLVSHINVFHVFVCINFNESATSQLI